MSETSEEVYGIDETKKALKAVCKIVMKLEEKNEDGQVTYLEAGSVVLGQLPSIISVVKNRGELKKEFMDYSTAEKEEMVEYVQDELDLDNDVVEVLIEKSFALIVAASELVEEYAKAIKAFKQKD